MNNFLIALKRFFSNKNTVTILGVLLALVILYFGYNNQIRNATSPVRIPYANQTIQPRTLITEDMISYMEMPRVGLKGGVITTSSLIVGRYSNYNTVIPEGSMFYSDVVVNARDLPDSAFGNIPDGYTVFNFPVTMTTTYGNSMFPNNYINLYFKAIDDDGKIMFGKLISNVKILDVKDSAGRHVFENTSEARTPSSLIFAVPEDMHLVLRKAMYLKEISAEIIPVPNTQNLEEEGEVIEYSSHHIKEFILSKTATVPVEELPDVSTDIIIPSDEENNIEIPTE